MIAVNGQLKKLDQIFAAPLIRLTKLTPNTAVLVNKLVLKRSKLLAKIPDKQKAKKIASEKHSLPINLCI